MENKNYTVYKHTTPSNKIYIGITGKDVKYRWQNGYGYIHNNNKHFENAILKYGWDNIKHEILFTELTKEEACLMEKFYIALYNTTNKKYGYNQTYGGESGVKHTDETKKKIGDRYYPKGLNHPNYGKPGPWLGKHHTEETKNKMKGENNPMYGKHHSKETKEKISKSNKGKIAGNNHPLYGKHLSENTRKKISVSLKGKMAGENHPMYGRRGKNSPHWGKHHTEETKKKISDSHIGKCHTEETKKKISEVNKGKTVSKETREKISQANSGEKHWNYGHYRPDDVKDKISKSRKGKYTRGNNGNAKKVVCITTGEIFMCVKDASEKYNIDNSGLVKCCKGKQKTTGKLPDGTPLKWMYYDDYLKQIEKEE